MYQNKNQRILTEEEGLDQEPSIQPLTPYNIFRMHWNEWSMCIALPPSLHMLIGEFLQNSKKYQDFSKTKIEKYFGYEAFYEAKVKDANTYDWSFWCYRIMNTLRRRAFEMLVEQNGIENRHVVQITPELMTILEIIRKRRLEEKTERNG